jgi:hypothetical protein
LSPFVESLLKIKPMRLNIILFFTFFWANAIFGQILVNEQKFDRSKLEFHLFLVNQGSEAVQIEAIGVASSYITLDVCDRAEKTIHLSESHMVEFEVDKPETIRNLLHPVRLEPGVEKGIVVKANPLPEAICDYWEADIKCILGFSNMEKWYSDSFTITEDDYYNFNDWLDQLEEHEGKQFTFEPDRLSRLQLVDWIQSKRKDDILKALASFNAFFWPTDEKERLLEPLLQDKDTLVQSKAQVALQQQQQKLDRALRLLKATDQYLPSEKKKAIQGLGLAQFQAAVPHLLELWKNDNEMEPHLIARTLMQIDDESMLPELLAMAKQFRKAAKAVRGFSHDRWKWLTVSALLAEDGYQEAFPVLEDCLRSALDNFEYPELRLILEALGRSEQETLKKALSPFYREAMQVNFSDDFTLAVLPLFLNYVDMKKEGEVAVLKPYLNAQHLRLQLEAIRLAGVLKLQALRPILEEHISSAELWEKRYYLFHSLEQLKK